MAVFSKITVCFEIYVMRTGQMTPEVVSSWPQLFLLSRTAAMVADINRIVLIVLAMDSFLVPS